MALSFRSVTLDTASGDTEAMLVFRDGRLVAVLCCLSAIHDDLAGHWFVEAAFADLPEQQPQTHETLAAFEGWMTGAISRAE